MEGSAINSESDEPEISPYPGPAGGWASVRSVEEVLWREGRLASGNVLMLKQNKPDGYACVSCAWAKPAEPHPFEYCENGAKGRSPKLSPAARLTVRSEEAAMAKHTTTA